MISSDADRIRLPACAVTDVVTAYGYVRAWLFVGVLTACYTFSLIDRYVISYVAVYIESDLGVNDVQLGLIQGFGFSLLYALAGLPLGWAVDRHVRKNLVAAAVAIWSSMTIATAFASSFVGLVIPRLGVGAGEAVLSPATYSMLPDMFSSRRLPMAMTVYSLGAVVAAAAGLSGYVMHMGNSRGVLVLPLFGEMRTWRVVLLAAGAPGGLLALLVLLSREPGRGDLNVNAENMLGQELRTFLRKNGFVHVGYCLAMTLTTLMAYALTSWTPSVLARAYAWSAPRIGNCLVVVSLISGLMGCVLGGVLARRLIRTGRIAEILLIALGAGGDEAAVVVEVDQGEDFVG